MADILFAFLSGNHFRFLMEKHLILMIINPRVPCRHDNHRHFFHKKRKRLCNARLLCTESERRKRHCRAGLLQVHAAVCHAELFKISLYCFKRHHNLLFSLYHIS